MQEDRRQLRETLRQTYGTLKDLRKSLAAADADYVLHDLGALLSVAEQEALNRLRESES
ncbi:MULTISPECIES: hypothetical protein [unclassified Mesorhizobium]|uniref:hypothetical protein n=1 Tax=unclassified Mesorhizobium TaxID=325217 RepID=UPI0030152A38